MTTVLFTHGLESGPRGHKARALEAAGFKVVAVQMPSGRNAVLRDFVTWLPLVLVIGSAFAGLVWFVATTLLVVLSLKSIRAGLTRRMWKRSVDIQREALRSNAIDAVLGSSFGGAVALELIARGDWKGPTVLLCPAHRLVAERARIAPSRMPKDANAVVVHGTRDEVVPLQHSRELVEGTNVQLIEVDDEHRLAKVSTPERLREWLERVC